MILQQLKKKGLINPPKFLIDNTQYLCYMGSVAYGVSSDSSDLDIYGFCIPPKEEIFPHLKGAIAGFGRQKKSFDQWQEHHILDESAKKEYDFQVYSIVKYFQLCMDNNPNMLDSLFVPERCVMHSTQIGNLVRENRKLFVHKGSWHKLKGYAYSQLHKMSIKNPEPGSKRAKLIEEHGYDTKFAYHVYRLMSQGEELLSTGNITLDEKGRREVMKAIRAGKWSEEKLKNYFSEEESRLNELYHTSTALPHSPDEGKIKDLLLECLKIQYGSLDKAIVIEGREIQALRDIRDILEKVGL